MKILILDNNLLPEFWGALDLRSAVHSVAQKQNGVLISVRRPPHEDLPDLQKTLDTMDAVIISGSKQSCMQMPEWAKKLDHFLEELIKKKKPLLGICYGHQTLGRILGGQKILKKSLKPEYGWTKLSRENHSVLLKDLPSTFYSFSSHQEEIHELPKECELTVSSKDCRIQGFEKPLDHIYALQFHPEKEGAKKTKGPSQFNPLVRELVFKNFLEIIPNYHSRG